jgi:hypothetical protein
MKKIFLMLICTLFSFWTTAQNNAANAVDTGGFAIAAIPDQIYTGVAFTPEIVIKDGGKNLVKNIDYTLAYANNVNVGAATVTILGKGNYQGTRTVVFQITSKSINTVNANPIADQVYRNAAITPDISIKDGNRPLIKDVDYVLAYANNINVGTATVTVTGKGNYKDTKSMSFRINAKSFGQTTPGSRQAGAATQSPTATGSTTKNNTTTKK